MLTAILFSRPLLRGALPHLRHQPLHHPRHHVVTCSAILAATRHWHEILSGEQANQSVRQHCVRQGSAAKTSRTQRLLIWTRMTKMTATKKMMEMKTTMKWRTTTTTSMITTMTEIQMHKVTRTRVRERKHQQQQQQQQQQQHQNWNWNQQQQQQQHLLRPFHRRIHRNATRQCQRCQTRRAKK